MIKFDHIQAYGSAGGVDNKLDVTAHIVGSGADRVEDVRRLVLLAPATLAALVDLQEEYRKLLVQYLDINQRAVNAIQATRCAA